MQQSAQIFIAKQRVLLYDENNIRTITYVYKADG